MSDTQVLDRTFHYIMKQIVATGQAPHYTEIAAVLGVAPDKGRQTMHTLFSRYKHDEWRRFHEHVTEWEQVEYLQFF